MARGPQPYRPTVVRYLDAEGRQVRKGTPGARKVTTKSDSYFVRLKVGGKRKPFPLHTTDYGEALVNLRALLRKQEERRLGIRDDLTEHAERPLAEHLKEWKESLRAKGTGQTEIDLKAGRLEKLREMCRWRRVTDITLDGTLAALDRLQTREGLSAQTRNHYATHAKQFTRWLARRKRLSSDPLAELEKVNVEVDRRHDRRCPNDPEIAALLREVDRPDAPVRRGMTGPQRALGYRLSMATGFRAGELRSLTRESFDLDAGTVTVRAAYSKNRREAVQHLPAWLVDELREWFAAGGGVWDGFPEQFPGRVLKADLKRAGVPWKVEVDGVPLFFDFHALRVWYISWAASLPGISPKTLMEMARHSDPRLTLRRYAKAKTEEVKATVARLPRPGEPVAPVAPEVAPNKETAGDGPRPPETKSTGERPRQRKKGTRKGPRENQGP